MRQMAGERNQEENVEAYTNFAEVYDTFMDNVPYEEWADDIQDILKDRKSVV